VQNAWGQAKDAAKSAADDTKAPKAPQPIRDDVDAEDAAEKRRSGD
jgi:hypothetical protein